MAKNPIQAKIIIVISILTLLIGFFVNLIHIDIWAGITFSAIVGLVSFIVFSQVKCLITGSCYFSAWFASITFSITLLTAIYFYSTFVISDKKLPSIAQQPITTLNPAINKASELSHKHLNINLFELDDTFRRRLYKSASKHHKEVV